MHPSTHEVQDARTLDWVALPASVYMLEQAMLLSLAKEQGSPALTSQQTGNPGSQSHKARAQSDDM